jgi:hypothetical protein
MHSFFDGLSKLQSFSDHAILWKKNEVENFEHLNEKCS